MTLIGCVRLTLFRNKNTWSDDLKRYVWRLICSNKNEKAMFKIAFKQMFDNINVNPRKNEGFLTSIPCIPIPEYGQSNAPLILLSLLKIMSWPWEKFVERDLILLSLIEISLDLDRKLVECEANFGSWILHHLAFHRLVGCVTHQLISTSVVGVGSLINGSQNSVWLLALEDDFRGIMKIAVTDAPDSWQKKIRGRRANELMGQNFRVVSEIFPGTSPSMHSTISCNNFIEIFWLNGNKRPKHSKDRTQVTCKVAYEPALECMITLFDDRESMPWFVYEIQ